MSGQPTDCFGVWLPVKDPALAAEEASLLAGPDGSTTDGATSTTTADQQSIGPDTLVILGCAVLSFALLVLAAEPLTI